MLLTWPYAHLLINHFPVVLSVSALALTILALVFRPRPAHFCWNQALPRNGRSPASLKAFGICCE